MLQPSAVKKVRKRTWRSSAPLLVLVVLVAMTCRLFVWPALDPLNGLHADAILVLGGPGPRLQLAEDLAREHAAPLILVSVASVQWNCPRVDLGRTVVQCFRPDPFSTQGEARYAGEEARRHRWGSIIVVTSTPQATRARIRVERCFSGTVKVVAARPSLADWAYGVLYEWGALAKALLWQTSC